MPPPAARDISRRQRSLKKSYILSAEALIATLGWLKRQPLADISPPLAIFRRFQPPGQPPFSPLSKRLFAALPGEDGAAAAAPLHASQRQLAPVFSAPLRH